MPETWTLNDCTLYLGDSREVLRTLPPESVDLVVTSPPYMNQRTYGIDGFDWDAVVPPVLTSVPLSTTGQMLVNLGLVHREGEVVCYWNTLIDAARDSGLRLFGWYVWDQFHGLPGDWSGRFAPSHEWVFHFNRNAKKPQKHVACKPRRGVVNGTGFRGKDGKTKGKMCHEGRPCQTHKIPDSVVRVCREMARNIGGHPAPFPQKFAQHLVRSFSGVVCDPFMGGGTTALACIAENRPFIGIELNREYFEIAKRRITEAYEATVLLEGTA